MNDPDHQDMTALSGGEDTALNRIMDRWSAPLYAFVYRNVQNREEASDIVQEAFVRVYRNRDRYRPGGRFSTWLFSIAVNLCRNRARWHRRHPTVSLEGEEGGALPVRPKVWESDSVTPDAALEQNETIQAVRHAVGRLPHDLRTALILSQYQELSHQEIAGIMNCTSKAVETRIYRARRKLRKWLADAAPRENVPPG